MTKLTTRECWKASIRLGWNIYFSKVDIDIVGSRVTYLALVLFENTAIFQVIFKPVLFMRFNIYILYSLT